MTDRIAPPQGPGGGHTAAPRTIDLGQLNQLLWRYRPLLERFEFLLEVQLMVTVTGRQDWQRHMADLFQETADALGALDLQREMILGEGPTGPLSLRELADDAPDPWGEILTEQQVELEAAVNRVSELRQRNTSALAEGSAGINQVIDALLQSSGQFQARSTGTGYGQDGRLQSDTTPGGTSAVLFDGRA
ncbi:MAG: flagellar export chaperone FlgN [Actinomycetota bacterium]